MPNLKSAHLLLQVAKAQLADLTKGFGGSNDSLEVEDVNITAPPVMPWGSDGHAEPDADTVPATDQELSDMLGRPFVSDAPMAEPVEPDETAHDDAYDLFGEDEEMNEPMDEGDGKDDGKDGSETTATPPFADPYTIDEDACSLTLSKMCVCVCVCVCVRVANLQ